MTLLPIVARELRVATRKKATYWNRSVSVLVGVVIVIYVLLTFGRVASPALAGAHLFSTLSRLTYLGCLFAGVFLTADCLSEEKRQGTLGLLFLTDLKGYDVVLGKLLASSLGGFYALLAIFPVLALPLVMGGVTLGEFCRTSLSLLNALIFSLGIGMLISSLSWQEQKAMLATAGLLVVTGLILPAAGSPFDWVTPRLAFGLAIDAAFKPNPVHFWMALLTIQALSWGLLWLTCLRAPRCWENIAPSKPKGDFLTGEDPASEKDTSARDGATVGEAAVAWQLGEGTDVAPLTSQPEPGRKELLERNPVLWLASRKRASGWIWGSLAVFGLGWFAVCLRQSKTSFGSFVESFFLVISLHGILKFWIAWEASRHFYEHRRNGILESLLSTPLTLEQIVGGHFRSLFQQFIKPVTVVLLLDFFLMSWLASSPFLQSVSSEVSWSLFSMVVLMAMLVGDALALAWLGLWLGLKARKSWTTAVGALVRILFLPTGVFLAVMVGLRGSGPMAYVVVWAIVGAINSLFFGLGAHSNLYRYLREMANQAGTPSPASSASIAPSPELPALGEYFSLFKN